MNFKLKNDDISSNKQVTRIEIRYGNKSKSLTLEDHTNAEQLSDYLKEKLAEITRPISVDIPITESPVRHVDKCMIQVYEATSKSISKKNNFKSFTCYGIDDVAAIELIKNILKQ